MQACDPKVIREGELVLDGYQIRLRDWQTADLDVYRSWGQPGHEWRKLDAPYELDPTQEQIEQHLSGLSEAIQRSQWPSPRKRLVVAERESNLLVGTVSCYGMSQVSNWPQVGVAIYDPANWRRGMGYAALGMWCEYLWQAFPGIVRLGLSTWSGNIGMIRLARKLGFQQEACLRKARVVDGQYYDALGYGVLRDEWYQRYPEGFASDSVR